jgi:hypothetical protein
MSVNGFYAAQEGHLVNILPPQNISGGATAQVFNMEGYRHASIIVQLGAQAAANTKILVNACTGASGDGAVAVPFNIFTQETAGVANDVLSVRTPVTATGYTPSPNANIFYVIELDADALPQGSPYVQLEITNGANANFASAVAVLSGGRFVGDQSPSATS